MKHLVNAQYMQNYLELWAKNPLGRRPIHLVDAVTVTGLRQQPLGPKSEFAKVQMTIYPADEFEVEDVVAERAELERLGVAWPNSAIFGVLDVLVLADFGPLYKVRVAIEKAWYHKVDSSQAAFRHAGRDAGLKLIEMAKQQGLLRY